MDHILLKCNFAHRTWSVVLGWFGCSWVLPHSFSDLFEAWICPSMAPRGKEMWKLSCLAVLYGLSGRRECKVFQRDCFMCEFNYRKDKAICSIMGVYYPKFSRDSAGSSVAELEGNWCLSSSSSDLFVMFGCFPFWVFFVVFQYISLVLSAFSY